MSNLPQFVLIVGTMDNASWRVTRAAGRPAYVLMDGDGSNVGETATKFELVRSTGVSAHEFHIRCCLNNKYLRRESSTSNNFVAEADEPDEIWITWQNTRFAQDDSGDGRITLTVNDLNLRRVVSFDASTRRLLLGWGSPNYAFRFVPWDTLVVLPRDVVLKGDNDRYLRSVSDHFAFEATDAADPLAAHTIHQRFDGSITISSNRSGEHFRIERDNVIGTKTPSSATNFVPVRVNRNRNVIALYVQNNNNNNNSVRFLHRSSTGEQLTSLSATTEIISEVKMIVEERVLSREIFNVVYRTPEAIVHDQENIMVATGQVFNASDAPNHVDMRLAYSLETSSSWSARIAGEFGVRSHVTAGIPFLKKIFRLEAEFEISASIDGEYEWSESVEEKTEVETGYAVEVPARSTMTISITASKATTDIPYSYTQRVTTFGGRVVTTRMDDGLYVGANCYDFQYEAIPSPIEARSLPPSAPLTMKSSNARRPSSNGPSAKL